MSEVELERAFLDREFPSRAVAVQLNHAAVSPIPRRSAEALSAFAARLSTHGGIDWRAWDAEAARLRALGARLLGAGERVGGASSISIISGTSSALNLVAHALDWKPGDVVVTTEAEFPTNLTTWLGLARFGVQVRRVPTRDGAFTAEEIAAACDARTRLVTVSAVAFHTGFLAPVAELAAFCRPRGILLGIDGIQAAGAVPFSVEEWDVDFLAADGHKWMLGPEGCGLLYTRPELRARLHAPGGWKNLMGPSGGHFVVPETPEYHADGTKLEPGAPPTPGVYALAASIELLLEIGIARVAERNAESLALLAAELPRAGFEPVLFGGPPRSGILAARPPAGTHAYAAVKKLAARGFETTARMGLLRLSPHVSVLPEEAASVVPALLT